MATITVGLLSLECCLCRLFMLDCGFPVCRMEWEQRRYEEELHQWQRMGGGRGAPFGQGGPMVGVHGYHERKITSCETQVCH